MFTLQPLQFFSICIFPFFLPFVYDCFLSPSGISLTLELITERKEPINSFILAVSPYKPFKVIFLQHLTSFIDIWRRTADIVDSFCCSLYSPVRLLNGIHLRNIFLKEKGSLFTAVASYPSISMIWNFYERQMWEKVSKISLEVNARGTLSLSDGRDPYFI